MRTTLNTIYSMIGNNLNNITSDMERINRQISTGHQMSRISDNPVNLVSALRFRSSIESISQYSENISAGNTIISASETAMTQMKELAMRAKVLAIQATDPAMTASNLVSISEEISNMYKQAVQLANSQVNGKYIFGGYRTTGYTDLEPTPFMIDKGDGHWINGADMVPLSGTLSGAIIESSTTAANLVVGDLLINGEDIGAVDLNTAQTGGDTNGISMVGANNLKTAINLATGHYSNITATADDNTDGNDSVFQFDVNGTTINVTIGNNTAATDTAAEVANIAIAAINAQSTTTGVNAVLGDGTNGGVADSVVFQNVLASDNSTIEVTNFTTVQDGGAALGFTDFNMPIVTATLTTQAAGAQNTGTGAELVAGTMDFSLNGIRLNYSITVAATATARVQQHVDALNQASSLTGVTATLGAGTNGGPNPSIILQNAISGDETDIVLANITAVAGTGTEGDMSGLVNGTYSVGAGNNTGELSFSSGAAFTITTSSTVDDNILTRIGLGGGNIGNYDEAGDGQLGYGYSLTSGELNINGIAVPATSEDGNSTIFADASAAAKAAAINSITSLTGVTANINNSVVVASQAVDAGPELTRPTGLVSNTVIRAGEIAINGTTITQQIAGGAVTNGLNMAKAFNANTEINAEALNTNVQSYLTTLIPNNTTATAGAATAVSFTLNGVGISFAAGGSSAISTALNVVNAINDLKGQTGVEAILGNGTNGGLNNTVVLHNSIKGNEDAIVVADLSAGETALTGLGNINQAADTSNNSGEISLDSENSIIISTPSVSPGADIILNELGFSSNNVTTVGTGSPITGTVDGTAIAGGTIFVNGTEVTGAIAGIAAVNGIFADTAASAVTQIGAADPNVQASLTTMTNRGAAASNATANSDISFKLNGSDVTVSYMDATPAASVAQAAVTAINQISSQTGVRAYVGNGASDGTPAGSAAANVIVFENITAGDDQGIVVSDFNVTNGNNNLGFFNFNQLANAANNNGDITITSNETFDISTPGTLNDSVLNQLGLGFGANTGFSEKNDGLIYGSTGVGSGSASFGASPKFINPGDLIINDIDIVATRTTVVGSDKTSALLDAINSQTASTGVVATRGVDGAIRLVANDGRNIRIQTSANGEDITHLTDGARDRVYFGSLQLESGTEFNLKTTDSAINSNEPGLSSIGLSGGSAITGEPGDIAGDGFINVYSIHDQDGTVRYAGDRINNQEIKIGKTGTMIVGENGLSGITNTTIFTTLKGFENTLRAQNYTTVTGIHAASDTTKTLNSKNTGLEPSSQLQDEDLFSDGSFTVTVTDHDFYPPRNSILTIGVDTSIDTLDSITKRIDGIPNITAEWTASQQLKISSDDSSRYTIRLSDDTSNFLKATGVSAEFIQFQAISDSMDKLDALMDNLTEQISDFGARANRMTVQASIYSELKITTQENLSEVQDTDMIKAIMELKAKEVAYQAALSSAAKTMQLSLVDYL